MIGTRVLLIEDEPALARGLSDVLRTNGFDVTVVTDGERGLDAAVGGQTDLILLDVMLPKVNGYEICRAVRAHGLDLPILMLTAKGQEQDVVLGLNLGADDYITKPFRVGELVARVRAFLRRRQATPSLVRFGDCEVDLTARRVVRAGKPVDLTAKECALLLYFATRPGCALSRDVILNAVWGNAVFVTPRSIDRCVTTLRAKVEPNPHRPTYIQTIRDIGYRFEPNVSSSAATPSHQTGGSQT
jgi:two-component system, OmpR family, alkaline phosphatase synthesis response regulator PhoP